MSEFIINKTLLVTTEFSKSLPAAEPVPAIAFGLFYPLSSSVPVITGLLAGNQKQNVQYRASDGFIIRGEFYTMQNRNEIVLLGNLFYGMSENPALQNHFEGTISIYPLYRPPVPPPTPPLPPIEDSGDFPEELAIDAPLFPYIYIQPWPAETARQQQLNFIAYNASATPSTSLYSQLAPMATAKNRTGMETCVLEFLQNEAPFADQFYGNLGNVPMPFKEFPCVYNLLRETASGSEYKNVLAAYFGYEDEAQLNAFLQQVENPQVIDQLWQNYFALAAIPGYREGFCIDINKILVVCNLIEQLFPATATTVPLTNQEIEDLLLAAIALPAAVFPFPPYQPAPPPAGNSWIEPYSIGRLKMTKYRLLRYQQGEVAQIQNVLKGEKKKIINRSLSNTAEQSVQHTQDSTENRSATHEGTNELLVETQKTVAALTKNINYDNLTTTYGPPTQVVLNGSYSKSIVPGAPGKEDSNSFANTVLNKTLNRINETVFKSRVFSQYNEKEETHSSIFDNQGGETHFRGIYRWVNKLYRISVENYGYRFLLELNIDSPAAAFMASQQALNNINLYKPLSPAQKGINSFNDITLANYAGLLDYYQVKRILLPPDASLSVSVLLNAGETSKYLAVPPGYQAASVTVTGQLAAGSPATAINGIVGNNLFALTAASGAATFQMAGETGQVSVAVTNANLPVSPPVQAGDFSLNAALSCQPTSRKTNEWQVSVYDEIMEGYEKLVAQYDGYLTRLSRVGQPSNPGLLNNIERGSLQNSCMGLLSAIAATLVGNAPGITPSQLSVNSQRYTQFINEVFEWDEMTYCFDDQPSKLVYALQGQDDSLRPFLQASYARVFLPVRPGSNFQVLYYLSSGMLWQAPWPFVPVNNTDTATAGHLKQVRCWHEARTVEKYWDIALPTSMQVVQESPELPDFYNTPRKIK